MLGKEIGVLLETKLQTKGYLIYDNLHPVEINLMFNSYIEKYIDKVLEGFREQIRTGGFDDTGKRLDDLRLLKKTAPLTPSSSTTSTVTFELPEDYRDYLRFRILVNGKFVPGRVLASDDLDVLGTDTYFKSSCESPIIEVENNNFIVYIEEGMTGVSEAVVRYIRKPDVFDILAQAETEYPLPNSVINRIIDDVVVDFGTALEQNPNKVQSYIINKQ